MGQACGVEGVGLFGGLRGKADPDSALRFYRRALQAGKAEAGAGVSRLSRRPDASTVLDVLPPQ